MSTSVIYFIQAGDDGPIKIGVTRGCPLGRMAALQTGCPDALKLVAHASGTIDDERALHARFAHLRLRGEWFLSKPELTDFIRGIRFCARNEKPLERRDEPMIGDLCLEDLERIEAYLILRRIQKQAEHAISCTGPHELTECEHKILWDLHFEFEHVAHTHQSDTALSHACQFVDMATILELGNAIRTEIGLSPLPIAYIEDDEAKVH